MKIQSVMTSYWKKRFFAPVCGILAAAIFIIAYHIAVPGRISFNKPEKSFTIELPPPNNQKIMIVPAFFLSKEMIEPRLPGFFHLANPSYSGVLFRWHFTFYNESSGELITTFTTDIYQSKEEIINNPTFEAHGIQFHGSCLSPFKFELIESEHILRITQNINGSKMIYIHDFARKNIALSCKITLTLGYYYRDANTANTIAYDSGWHLLDAGKFYLQDSGITLLQNGNEYHWECKSIPINQSNPSGENPEGDKGDIKESIEKSIEKSECR